MHRTDRHRHHEYATTLKPHSPPPLPSDVFHLIVVLAMGTPSLGPSACEKIQEPSWRASLPAPTTLLWTPPITTGSPLAPVLEKPMLTVGSPRVSGGHPSDMARRPSGVAW